MDVASRASSSSHRSKPIAVGEQAQCVHDHEQCRPLMHGDGRPDPKTKNSCRNQNRHHAQTDEDILSDDRSGLPRQANRERQMGQIVRHQRYVGSLQRDVGARCTHGNSNGRIRHRGSVVHTVADHRDLAVTAQLLDRLDLVFRHQVTPRLVDANLARNSLGNRLIVARNHDHPRDAERAERRQRRLGCRAGRVHQADNAKLRVTTPHDHRRPSARTKPCDHSHRIFR